ncbi:glycosyltransferase family 61 protein [Acidiphilium sp. PA]|uniref:hypothetical protein n=1 Tax=Acidiphilium sp. PA TaxID=2871705 RepID=UPI00224468E1|nr:hypothetical protein [Acidiphilium sp. PA]MCW8307148.1 glycosyltransferase family 61 protein [Acidiphilium sp. PA]
MSGSGLFRLTGSGWGDRLPRWSGTPDVPTQEIETIALEDGIVVPAPFAVLNAEGLLQQGTMPATRVEPAPMLDDGRVLVPLAAGPTVPLGRFIGESLAIASLQGAAAADVGFIGGPLLACQIDALVTLGLLGRYMPIAGPVRVPRLQMTRLPGRGSLRAIRPVIEVLRFGVEPYEVSKRVAMLASPGRSRFGRINQGSLHAWLRAQSFGLLDAWAMTLGADQLGLADLIAVLAAARVIVIDDPAQAALLGFCDPAALVLELGVEGWADPTIGAIARLFGLEWRLSEAAPPRYPVKARLPVGARHMLRTEVDIGALDRALLDDGVRR